MSQKIVEKSIRIANELFPVTYQGGKYRTYHWCFIYHRNKLLSIGQNYPREESSKAIKLTNKFNCPLIYKRAYVCAEVDAISRLWGKTHIDNRLKFVILRLNKNGELKNSKPCPNCQTILDALGITKVCYSNELGEMKWQS